MARPEGASGDIRSSCNGYQRISSGLVSPTGRPGGPGFPAESRW
jgi:hypothetical protein